MWYQLILLIHLLAVISAFFAVGSLAILRALVAKAQTLRDASMLLSMSASVAMLMPIFSVLLLASGIALTRLAWRFTDSWVILSIVGLVVLSVIGGAVLKPRGAALHRALEAASELSSDLRDQLADPTGARAERVNIAVSLAIVVLMVLKPSWPAASAIVVLAPLAALIFDPTDVARRETRHRIIQEETRGFRP